MLCKLSMVAIDEASNLPLAVVANIPGRIGVMARRAYWKRRLFFMGEGVIIGRNVSISSPENVSIGDHSWIDDNVTILSGPPGERLFMHRLVGHKMEKEGILTIGPKVHVAIDVVLQAHGGLNIEEGVGIASGSKIYSLSHHYRNPAKPDDSTLYFFGPLVENEKQSLIVGNVELKKGSAVGLNSVVLPGAELAEYSWLGSASVLTLKTPKGAILIGNPAKVIKYRPGFEQEKT